MAQVTNQRAQQRVWLWTLRILVPLGGLNEFLTPFGYEEEHVAKYLGLTETIEKAKGDEKKFFRKARAEIRDLHLRSESQRRGASTIPARLARNLKRLKKLFGLDDIELQILGFAILIASERILYSAADQLESMSSDDALDAIAIILGIKKEKIRAALSSSGRLSQTGLIGLATGYENKLRHTLKLLSEHFIARMLRDLADPADLIRDTVTPGRPAELSFADFTHASESLDIVRPFMRRSVERTRPGVNIFIHGDPGTGKSQLVRLLAEDAGCSLFEVSSENAEGDPINGLRRLQSYRAAQSFLKGQQAMILFDETEDIFNDGDAFMGRKSSAQSRKAWMNRMLEENPVPTIWLSNDVTCLDAAFVRRFDFVMELKIPSKRLREAMIHAECGDLVTSEVASRIASSDALAPAVIARAASVVKVIRGDLSLAEQGSAVARVISNTLVAQGHNALPKADATRLPIFYDPGFINADTDLAGIADGIDRSKTARLCLFGPSGTGKSAFGRWLAVRRDCPLHIAKASDLLSPYLGVTEQNIARAFEAAEIDGAILLLDEVDSFLQDRRGAKYSWEVAQVNEMLTQMEAYSGIFIATTNLMDGLDQAALRRFDAKVRFSYLKPEQAWQVFCRQCTDLDLPAPSFVLRPSLDAIAVLTPGDFAAVARQHRFRPIKDGAAFLKALNIECMAKEDGRRRTIGFN